MGWQTLPQECKHVLVGRELVIAFGARPTFGGNPPNPPRNANKDMSYLEKKTIYLKITSTYDEQV